MGTMNSSDFAGKKVLTGYPSMAEFLTSHGFETSKSTLSKIGAPSVREQLPPDERLPIVGYWGVLPTAIPEELLAWAWRRLRQTHPKMPDTALDRASNMQQADAAAAPPPTAAEPAQHAAAPKEAFPKSPCG